MQGSFVIGVLVAAGLVFAAPADVESLSIAERRVGNAGADLGMPARCGVHRAARHLFDHTREIEDRL
jgi:hypothetical protein